MDRPRRLGVRALPPWLPHDQCRRPTGPLERRPVEVQPAPRASAASRGTRRGSPIARVLLRGRPRRGDRVPTAAGRQAERLRTRYLGTVPQRTLRRHHRDLNFATVPSKMRLSNPVSSTWTGPRTSRRYARIATDWSQIARYILLSLPLPRIAKDRWATEAPSASSVRAIRDVRVAAHQARAGVAEPLLTTARATLSSSADMAAECLRACLSLGCGELPLRLLVERDVGGCEVLLQVRHRRGAGYQQDVGRQAQGPGQRDLGRGRTEPSGGCPDGRIAQHRVVPRES